MDRLARLDRLERPLVAVAAVGAGLAIAARRLGDFDLPWHLAFGRVVAQTRSVPVIDDLTYAHPAITYTEWMSDVALYGVERLGGARALQALGGLACAALVAALAARARDEGARIARGAVLALAVAAIAPWLVVRPAVVTLILAGLLVWLFERRAAWALALTVPLTAAWANLHQGVLLAPALAAAWAAHAVVQRARGRADEGPSAGWAVACALGVALAAGASRAGLAILTRPFGVAPLADLATEWGPLDWRFVVDVAPLAGAFFALVAAALAFGRDARTGARAPAPFDVALVLVALATLRYVRMVPVAIVLLAPLAARRLGALALSLGARAAERARAVSLAALLLAPLAVLARVRGEIGKGWDPNHFPDGAVAWIEASAPKGAMWNFASFGGWLEWRLYPRYRPFIDGRVLDMPLALRARASEFDPRAFAALAAERDMQWAVCRAREGEAFCVPVSASPAWTMVYLDDASAIYVKKDGPNADLAAHGYARLRHLTTLAAFVDAAVAPSSRAVAAALRHDGDLALAQAPDSPRAALLAACGALAEADRDAFDRSRATLARLAPGHPALGLLDGAWDAHRAPPR